MGASIDLAVWVKEARTFASKTQDDLAADAAFFLRLCSDGLFFSKLNPIENQQNIAKSTKI